MIRGWPKTFARLGIIKALFSTPSDQLKVMAKTYRFRPSPKFVEFCPAQESVANCLHFLSTQLWADFWRSWGERLRTSIVLEAIVLTLDVYEMAASMAEDTSSQAAREAEKAASELMKSVSALAHLQRAYEAGFERAKTIAVNTKRSGSRDASDVPAYAR